jgi:hypothetical protein
MKTPKDAEKISFAERAVRLALERAADKLRQEWPRAAAVMIRDLSTPEAIAGIVKEVGE